MTWENERRAICRAMLAREKVTAFGRDLEVAAARHGEPEPTEARLTRVHGVGLVFMVK